MPTAYPYEVGADPQFDAFRAKYDFTKTNSQADADARRAKVDEDYKAALSSLADQGKYGRRNLTTNMLERGVFKSGETNRRAAELEATLLQGQSAADAAKANALGQVSSDLQRAMTSLDLDWESAYSDALSRVADEGANSNSNGGGGGGGGGGTTQPAQVRQQSYQPYVPPSAPVQLPFVPGRRQGFVQRSPLPPRRPVVASTPRMRLS